LPHPHMRARWSRALLAMFFASSAAALGAAALTAGPAQAATPQSGACGLNPCAPDVNIVGMDAAGTVTVVYTQQGPIGTIDLSTATLTVTWAPTTPLPPGAPAPTTTSVTLSHPVCTGSGTVTCTYPFPSDLQVASFTLNGTYGLSSTVKSCTLGSVGCTSGTKATTAALSNQPSAPTNVKAALVPNSSTVKITWTPSPEPDVAGYRVFRTDKSLACQVSITAAPPDYSCVDSTSGGGSFAYHVVAYRWGPGYSIDPSQQPASANSAPSASVVVPGPPATTTTIGPSTTIPPLAPPGFTGKISPSKVGGTGVSGLKSTPRTVAPAAVGDNPAPGSDTGFLPNLPYGQQPTTTIAPDPGVVASTPLAHKGKTSVGTIAIIGAGLLVAVIALHGLWLRAEVRRSGTLEALDPEA
jgi:hypothetical protein